MENLNKISILLIGLLSFLFGCSNSSFSADTTGKNMAKVLGLDSKLYEENNNSYNANNPIEPNKANITYVDGTKSYFLVVSIEIGQGSIPPIILQSSFSIIYDSESISLDMVTDSESDDEFLSYVSKYHIVFKKENFLTQIVLQLDEYSDFVILSTDYN